MRPQATPCASLLEAAVQPGAPTSLLAEASDALTRLAARAWAEPTTPAFSEYQHTLYKLHDHDDPKTDVARRYLAAQAYRTEERHIPRVELAEPLSEVELADRIQQSLSSSRSVHPVVKHVVFGTPSVADLKIFLKYQWFRTYKLYQDATDLAVTLMGDVDEGAMLYRYLFEEIGETDAAKAHAILLQNLCRHFEVPSEFSLQSSCLEEIVYLNNRRRSFRSPQPEWAYAIFYVTELVVSAVHRNFYETLQRLGVPESGCEYYKVHIEMVPPRAKREWKLFWRRLQHKPSQEIFLSSLAQHLRVESTYFDVIWADIQGASNA